MLAKARAGDAEAQFLVGRAYQRGEGVEADWNQAAVWFQKAAEQGHMKAQHNLGGLLLEGNGVPADPAKAVEWFRKAAAQGAGPSHFVLGRLHETGRGVPRNLAAAATSYRAAVDAGFVEAEGALASLLFFGGEGFLPDRREAALWYAKAAARGNATAQNAMGVLAELGDLPRVAPDYERAAEWFIKAARQGEPKAQANLGRLILEQRWEGADLVEAYAWIKLSADRGEATGRSLLPDVLDQLSPAQRAEGDVRARQLQEEIVRRSGNPVPAAQPSAPPGR